MMHHVSQSPSIMQNSRLTSHFYCGKGDRITAPYSTPDSFIKPYVSIEFMTHRARGTNQKGELTLTT